MELSHIFSEPVVIHIRLRNIHDNLKVFDKEKTEDPLSPAHEILGLLIIPPSPGGNNRRDPLRT
jgi:hypothetical protein